MGKKSGLYKRNSTKRSTKKQPRDQREVCKLSVIPLGSLKFQRNALRYGV